MKGINEKPIKIISTATHDDDEVKPSNELCESHKKLILSLTPFAKIDCFRFKFKHQNEESVAYIDLCLMPDNNYYSFFQLKKKSKQISMAFEQEPNFLKSTHSKVILYLHILYKINYHD
jgi:hypothetical protein